MFEGEQMARATQLAGTVSLLQQGSQFASGGGYESVKGAFT